MPLPNDEKLLALVNDLLQQFDQIFGLNPGLRPAHAKGTMLKGTFHPTPAAAAVLPKATLKIQLRFQVSILLSFEA